MENQSNQPTNKQNPDPVVSEPMRDPEDLISKTKTNQKWSLKKMLLAIVGSIIIFIIALIAIVNISTSAPVSVSDKLVKSIQANESSVAYDLLSSDAKATISLEDLKSIVGQISPILNGNPNLQSKEIKSGTNGSSAEVVYEIKGNDGNTYRFTVNLVEKSGEWKVLNFESKKTSS